jgi:hypothetical protein
VFKVITLSGPPPTHPPKTALWLKKHGKYRLNEVRQASLLGSYYKPWMYLGISVPKWGIETDISKIAQFQNYFLALQLTDQQCSFQGPAGMIPSG